MKRLMLDIETLASTNTSAVIAIGWAIFDVDGVSCSGEILINKDMASALGDVSEDTLEWWESRDSSVMNRMFSGETIPIAALHLLSVVAKGADEVWGHGPQFDLVNLRSLHRKLGVKCPWHYRSERCFRTLISLAKMLGLDYESAYENNQKHSAEADAVSQARAAAFILKAMKEGE